jgi:hypothetical protein
VKPQSHYHQAFLFQSRLPITSRPVYFTSDVAGLSEGERRSGPRFRRFLENFDERETNAPMADNVVAALVLPFSSGAWLFAVVQLAERALATIAATTLAPFTLPQLAAAVLIEGTCSGAECCLRPFTDPDENSYNSIFRAIALGVLATAIFIELSSDHADDADDDGDGDGFWSGSVSHRVGTLLLVAFVLLAFVVFVHALDPVRLHAAYRRHTATVAFRKEPLLAVTADNLHQHQKKGDATTTLGELGQRRRSSQQYHGALATGDGSDGSGSSVGGSRDVSGALSTPLGDTSTKAVSESLESALEEVPKNFRLSSVVKDAFSYVRKYQLVPYQLRCNSVN